MVLTSEWSQIEVIDLINNGCGLGFMLVGGKSTGVVVKAIVLGGLAERDGRLQSGDHILQIGDVNLRGFSSEQVAAVLRQCGPHVRLVVARPIEPASTEFHALNAPIVPTKLLNDPDQGSLLHMATLIAPDASTRAVNAGDALIVNEMLEEEEDEAEENENNDNNGNEEEQDEEDDDDEDYSEELQPETETFEVELRKNVYGFGITVAGYVCEDEDLNVSGIFIRSIIEGSAAEKSNIQENDRIVAVDGISLNGVSNFDAVEILKNTDIIVKLKLERYLRGRKYEHLQVVLDSSRQTSDSSVPPSPSMIALSLCAEEHLISHSHRRELEIQSPTPTNEAIEPIEASTDKLEIITCRVTKNAGLGISLEGIVNVEDGKEVHPHHYIRSILPNGPVGRTATLKPGDELLQVNEQKLQGLNHAEVVKILRDLPSNVILTCARGTPPPTIINTSKDMEAFETRNILPRKCIQSLVRSKSDSSIYTSSSSTLSDQQRSKSVEISDLALWSTDIVYVDIEKTTKGFGFSILDYQDPLETDGTVIVVRGIIPGGSAEAAKTILPGDRIVSVNSKSLHHASLDEAVEILNQVPIGLATIGLCRPLSMSDVSSRADTPMI